MVKQIKLRIFVRNKNNNIMEANVSLDYAKDLAVTTAYIYSELIGPIGFFSNIDEAMAIAISFIEKYPTDTNWDENGLNWEESLIKHYIKF